MKILWIFLITVCLLGCATSGKISSFPMDAQKVILQDNQKILVSIKKNIVTMVPATEVVTSGQKGSFFITVLNRTENGIVFSSAKVSAVSIVKDNVSALNVYHYNELITEQKKKQMRAYAATVLKRANEPLTPAYTGYSHTRVNYYDKDNNPDPYANTAYKHKSEINIKTDLEASKVAKLITKQRQHLNEMSAYLLKPVKVSPNTWCSGLIKIQLPEITEQMQRIQFTVDIGKETHKFAFRLEKISG